MTKHISTLGVGCKFENQERGSYVVMIVALPKKPERGQLFPNAKDIKSTHRSADMCHLWHIYLHIYCSYIYESYLIYGFLLPISDK